MALPLEAFTYMGDSLPAEAKDLQLCENDYEVTTHIIDKLRLCHDTDVRRVLDKDQVIIRLFRAKQFSTKAGKEKAVLDLDDTRKAYAITLYLVMDKENSNDCNTCRHPESKGPADKCIGGSFPMMGACTNCYYSGSGPKCSLGKELREFVSKNATTEELIRLTRMMEEEKKRREEQDQFPK